MNKFHRQMSICLSFVQTVKAGSGTMSLGGSLTRQAEADHNVSDASPHIANIGKMVEVRPTFDLIVSDCVSFCTGNGE